ncbi:globin family protein [Teredinibacter purpureus]|uniref:globin family protein n=1 Tax=Teredinibacter purpureus TaxID=2731756 RepID=UPI0005F81168|nr:globin family protein [Teredinibacter purpureus]
MAITARQKQLVQESFSKVAPIADQAAEIFYTKLFEFDPGLRPLFKNDMKSQGRKLMSTLKVAIKGLDDLNSLVPVLEKIAVQHLDYGVRAQDYTPVGNALLYALKMGLGDQWNPELRQAWVDTFRIVAKVMKDKAYG